MDNHKQENLAIGIIGLGYMGLHHLKALRKLAQDGIIKSAISHVCDSDHDRLDQVSKKYGIARASDNYHELLADKNLDAVYVATPWSSHREITMEAFNHGLHVFCEKPLGINLSEVETMAAAAAAKKSVIAQTGLVLRHSPCLNRIKKSIREKEEWGVLRQVTLREDAHLPQGGIHKSDLSDRLAGRGIVWEENIHDLDTLIFLLGDLELEKAVFHQDKNLGVETGANVMLKTSDDVLVQFVSAWHHIAKRGSSRRLELIFEHALVSTEYFTSGDIVIITPDHPGGITIPMEYSRKWYIETMRFDSRLQDWRTYPWYSLFTDLVFMGALSGKRSPEPTFEDSLKAHRLAEEIYRAAF